MTRRQRRLVLIAVAGTALSAALALVLVAFQQTIVFFNSPTEIVERGLEPGMRVRLGGLVLDGSIAREPDAAVRFVVTDMSNTVTVRYAGLLPDLFREGQGVVAEGSLRDDGVFVADTVLARHDETYMPREVADALKEQGHWMDGGGEYGGR